VRASARRRGCRVGGGDLGASGVEVPGGGTSIDRVDQIGLPWSVLGSSAGEVQGRQATLEAPRERCRACWYPRAAQGGAG
jgi:hypothetical protein